MTFLDREEWAAAAHRRNGDGGGPLTGSDARDWLVAQAASGGD